MRNLNANLNAVKLIVSTISFITRKVMDLKLLKNYVENDLLEKVIVLFFL